MKPRWLFLAVSLAICIAAVAVVIIKGHPEDRVSFDAVAELGEGLLNSVHKAVRLFRSIDETQEMELGGGIHTKILHSTFFRPAGDAALGKYVSDVGGKVAANVKRPGILYTFHVVEYAPPMAGSIAGGHVYVSTGLIKSLTTEAELAGALGHEITHVDAKHCINSIRCEFPGGDRGGSDPQALADVGYNLFLKPGYSEAQELEADAGGVYLAYRAGYDPMASVVALERIDKDESSGVDPAGSLTPVGDTVKVVGGMVVRYFDTHPPIEDRVNRIKKYIADNRWIGPGQRFYVGERNFKERVSSVERRYKEEFR